MKEKERYSAPETEVLEVHHEGVLCASVYYDVYDPFSGNTEDTWTE